ncbi:unnamed protein product [Coccothraustes coccothraustes]
MEVPKRRCRHGSRGPPPRHSRDGVMQVKVYNSDTRFPFAAAASPRLASHRTWNSGTSVTPSPVPCSVTARSLSREASGGHSCTHDNHSFQKQGCGKKVMFT